MYQSTRRHILEVLYLKKLKNTHEIKNKFWHEFFNHAPKVDPIVFFDIRAYRT
jgi:hypothetical protein